MKSASKTGFRVKGLMRSRREEVIEKQYYEIKALESKYQKLYDASPVMLRTINTDGIILDCNKAYVDNLRYSSRDQVIDHSIFEHSPEDKVTLMKDSFEEWKRTGSVRNKEVWMKRNDGTTFIAMINASNLYGEGGVLVGSNTVITDLTEHYRIIRELEKAFEMKEDFVRIAAHELRTPIQPILMCAEAGRRGFVRANDAFEIILADARRLKRLADNILDVSRIEGGRLTYEFEMQGINALINEVVASTKVLGPQQARDKGQNALSIETLLDKDVQLNIDKIRLSQALFNIISNATKFTKEGRISIETKVQQNKYLEIKISDTGPGISPKVLSRLFEKFASESSEQSSNQHGTGLGLFITRSIILAHSGEIFAYNNNRDGGDMPGASFVIRLPCATASSA